MITDEILKDTGVYDIYNVHSSASAFVNNTFETNAVGQKGSAIYARQVNNLFI